MKLIKEIKKASMSKSKKDKKKVAKKIDKKILKALKNSYMKAKGEMEEAKAAYDFAKKFSEDNLSDKPRKAAKKFLKDGQDSKKKKKKKSGKKSTSTKTSVATLEQLEPTPEKVAKKLPKPLRIVKPKAAKATPTVAKRKPGRPKATTTTPTVAKRKPGRPKATTTTPTVAKRKPGRPKATTTTPTVAKRKPGRPKATTTTSTVAKRKPGRPKATPATTTKSTTAPSTTTRKKPGRKPKVRTKPTGAELENMQIIEGIGPAIERVLKANGVKDLVMLSKSKIADLKNILVAAGNRYRFFQPNSWPKQAKLAVAGKWTEFDELQNSLNRGRTK